MIKPDSILEIGGLAATAYGLYQSKSLHEKEKKLSESRHHESVRIAEEQHRKELRVAKQTYLMAAFTSLEQHFQQLNADLISSSKESENDMFDQRNQSFQTIILSSSVMFSSLSTVIIQGILPTNSTNFIFVSYALTCSLSFAFLFLCIVLCIEIILRASSFMYNRAKNHTDNLKNAIAETKDMMDKIRDNHKEEEDDDGDDGEDEEKDGEFKYGDNNYIAPDHQSKFRRKIADMSEEDLEKEWNKHEQEVHEYLDKREKINEKCSILASGLGGSRGITFEQFWSNSCQHWSDLAIMFFYMGTANLLLAIMIFMWDEFLLVYVSPEGAIVSVILVGLSLVVGVAMAVMLRRQDDKNEKDQNLEEEAVGQDYTRQLIGISGDERDVELLGRVGASSVFVEPSSPRPRSGSLFDRFSPRGMGSTPLVTTAAARGGGGGGAPTRGGQPFRGPAAFPVASDGRIRSGNRASTTNNNVNGNSRPAQRSQSGVLSLPPHSTTGPSFSSSTSGISSSSSARGAGGVIGTMSLSPGRRPRVAIPVHRDNSSVSENSD